VSEERLDSTTKKLIKMYKNYGIDISNMSDEEFERMRQLYERNRNVDIDSDLVDSEQHSDTYSDDIL
jgi:hypothetical protein